ncbi:MAG: GtrA-like protein [Candidatus Parcubacteria bacterium]|jgi:putative flippase GtrA
MMLRLPFLSAHEITPAWLWTEFRKVVKFGLVGGSTFLIYFLLYRWFRETWTQGSYTLMAFVASVVSSIYNFFMHRRLTFRSSASVGKSATRYVMVLMFCTMLQTGLFFLGNEVLHLFDYLVLFLVAVPVAATSYLLHRVFTFHPRHGVR